MLSRLDRAAAGVGAGDWCSYRHRGRRSQAVGAHFPAGSASRLLKRSSRPRARSGSRSRANRAAAVAGP